MSVNLWDETISRLGDYGLTWDDVEMVWIDDESWRSSEQPYKISKEDFKKLAKGMMYNNDFGSTEINEGLHMRGHDKDSTPFVMLRNEYDGSEWWEVHRLYTDLPIKKVKNLGKFPFEERWSE